MAIRAVVFDVGGVLEVVDDPAFPSAAEQRLGRALDLRTPGDGVVGEHTEAELRRAWQEQNGLSDVEADGLMQDFWRWYVGTLDAPLFDWFRAQRAHRMTAILSNSAPGAREAERHHGFEEATDHLVYSHEVGLKKPDPAVFRLTAERLGVDPHEVLFLDDLEGHVTAARAAGWHAVLHRETARSILEMERVIETETAVRSHGRGR